MTPAPSFRIDLQTEAIQDGGHRFVDVQCLDSGNAFRFYEVEYALACGMDGKRDVSGLVQWAKAELDLVTTPDEVSAIVNQLAELNYLVDGASASAPRLETPDVMEPEPLAAAPSSPAAAASGLDLELGESGKSPMNARRPKMPTDAPDLELGHSGSARKPKPAVVAADAPASELMLGVAGNEGAPEFHDEIQGPSTSVSTDLSQTFRIDKDEVKAAVRASKVMSAVTLPDDLAEELAQAEAAKVAAVDKSAAIPEAVSPANEISAQIAAEVVEDAKESVASESAANEIELPTAPEKVTPVANKNLPAEKDTRPSASYALWAVLLIATLLGAGYYYMEYVREDPDKVKARESRRAVVKAKRAKAKAAPPKPVTPSATLAVGAPVVTDVLSGKEGKVVFGIESGTDVAIGDVLLSLKGSEKPAADLAKAQTSLAEYKTKLLRLEKGKSATRIAKTKADVARKEVDIANAITRLEALQIRAESAGNVELLVEVGGDVTPDTTIAKMTGPPALTATFTLLKGESAAEGDDMKVVSKDGKITATCKVTAVKGQSTTVQCPSDVPVGTKIELVP